MLNLKIHEKGFTLIELLISLFVIMMIMLGVYSLIIISLRLNSDNAFFIEATEIANQKMEQIRNLSYDDVGTLSGFPVGVIPEDETIIRSGRFNIHTSVIFYDDPYDGEAGSGDLIFADYKIVTIKVSWMGKFKNRDISIFSKIIPATEETITGYGLLKISVVNSAGAPVSNPNITIKNPIESIDMTITANTEGKLSLPLPPGFENYEVTITKTNYGTDKTYPRDAVNPNPTKPNISILDGLKTEESFSIDKLSLLTIKTFTNTLPINWNVNPVATTTSNSAISASADSSGNTYIAWQNSAISTSSIFIQKFDSTNTPQWANPKQISDTTFQKNPNIVTATNGNSFVVWKDNSTFLKATAYNPINKIAVNYYQKPQLLSDFFFYPSNLYSFSTPPTINSNKKTISFKKFAPQIAWAAAGTVTTVGVSSGTTDNTRYITLSTPSGVLLDDLLVAYIESDYSSNGPIIAPAGWNTLDDNLDPSGWYSGSRGAIFWKFASASEGSSHTFYLSAAVSEEKAGHIRAYRGVDKANPFDGLLVKSSTSYYSRYHSAPSKVVTMDGSMLVCGWGADTYTLGNVSGGPTFPSGMTNTVNTFAANVTADSADMPVNISDSPTPLMTFDARQYTTHASINWCFVLKPEIIPDDLTVSALGNQNTNILSPSSDNYLGGTFVFSDDTGTKSLSTITITDNGTVDASLNLSNIKLFYDLDSSAPYDCQDETFNAGLDAQFGLNTTFNSANGKATFNSSPAITISPTQVLCIYPVLDVLSSANSGDTIDFFIEDPSTEVIIDSGVVIPSTPIYLNGSTQIIKPAVLTQIHYRIRNDDGGEDNASWNNYQDSSGTATINDYLRMRIEISNTGDISSSPINYTLEYGEKISTCAAISSWDSIPTDTTKHWQIFDSSYVLDDATTTNISDGLTDENTTFHPGYIKDLSNQTPAFAISADQFTEIEFTIKATNNANNSDYCFRLTNNGLDTGFQYSQYPLISVTGDNNIYIQGFDDTGSNLWSVKKVNSDTGDADQRFPKIALTESLGIATTVIAWEDNRDGNYNIYAQSIDANKNILWASDLQITASSTNENSIDLIFDSQHNFIIAWIDNSTGNNEIYLNKFDLDGNQIWPSEINISQSNINEYLPKLSIDPSDNIYLSYFEDNFGVSNSKIKQLDSNGNQNWESNVNTTNSTSNQSSPAISIAGSYLFAIWTDTREGNNDIFAQKFDFSGNPLWISDQRINVNTGTTDQNSSFLVTNSNTKTIGMWRDNRDGEFNIYSAEVSDPLLNSPAANVPLIVTGTKKIGENPELYEYDNHNLWADSTGNLDLMLEWDSGYTFEINSASTSLSIIKRDPVQPLELLPDSTKTISIYVE